MRFFILTAFALLGLCSCTGYKIQGKSKPAALTKVQKIHVPLFENKTLIPRGESMATSAMIDAITLDGTYRIADVSQADAILQGTFDGVTYTQVRSTRLDTLRSEEMEDVVHLRWQLVDAKNPLKIIASGKARGNSRFAIDANQQTARTNALPDALQRACKQIIGRITDDF